MIPNGSRVQVDMRPTKPSALVSLLNSLGGEVVLHGNTIGPEPHYLIAYDLEHLPKIQRARTQDNEGVELSLREQTLRKRSPTKFPGDDRYYLLAFQSEVKQI